MLKTTTQKTVTAALTAALGVILPYACAHAFGLQGTVILPMHIPVLLCGLLCGPRYGALCGVTVPVLSSLLTGMPAPYPMLPIMLVQLLAMGLVSGLLYQKMKQLLLPSLLVAQVAGWAMYALSFAALFRISGGLKALPVTAALTTGLPGLAVQLILIPAVILAAKKLSTREKTDPLLSEALSLIDGGAVSCVVIKDGAIVHTADGRGVSPLLRLYENEPETLKGAFVVDKIIGKAAAMLLVLGGAKRVYGMVMSAAGRGYLESRRIMAGHGCCIDMISGRDGTGICPIEKSVLELDDPRAGLDRIRQTLEGLRKNA